MKKRKLKKVLAKISNDFENLAAENKKIKKLLETSLKWNKDFESLIYSNIKPRTEPNTKTEFIDMDRALSILGIIYGVLRNENTRVESILNKKGANALTSAPSEI